MPQEFTVGCSNLHIESSIEPGALDAPHRTQHTGPSALDQRNGNVTEGEFEMQIEGIRTNHETADGNIWKGVVAGLTGGLVASLVMSQFQTLWSKAGEALERKAQSGQDSQNQQKSESKEDHEDPTMKAAEKLANPVLGRHLIKEEKKSAGPIIHYAFGALMGGTYGLASELAPVTRSLFGLPYGAALFVAADEVAVPALGLSKPPSQTPPSSHLYGLASHLVYAATLETVRRNVRRIL